MKPSDFSKYHEFIPVWENWWEMNSEDKVDIEDSDQVESLLWWIRGANGEEGPDESLTCMSALSWAAGYAYSEGVKKGLELGKERRD